MINRIGILVKQNRIYSYENQSFRQEAKKLKINLDFLVIEKFNIKINNQENIIMYDNQDMKNFDFIINRIGSAITEKDACIVDLLALYYPVINSGSTALLLKNKFKTLLKLQNYNIPIIPTQINNDKRNYKLLDSEFPIIYKANSGSIGKGIYKINSAEELKNIVELTNLIGNDFFYLTQDFIDDFVGVDIRIIVFLGQIVGIMQRKAGDGDFKANFSIHGNVEKIEVTKQLEALALQICDILECDLAGIDLIPTNHGYLVCEVNSSPGFKGMDIALNSSVANKLLFLGMQKYKKNDQ